MDRGLTHSFSGYFIALCFNRRPLLADSGINAKLVRAILLGPHLVGDEAEVADGTIIPLNKLLQRCIADFLWIAFIHCELILAPIPSALL
ncbi:hypothetical protein RC55_02455 [Herbaspirillum seropedicae]|nr:hypothetical protein ACP92_17400 [Herbaspirillum seropedicae]NQE28135.1 hypothetical protein [Herbaspirillum seropedicae]